MGNTNAEEAPTGRAQRTPASRRVRNVPHFSFTLRGNRRTVAPQPRETCTERLAEMLCPTLGKLDYIMIARGRAELFLAPGRMLDRCCARRAQFWGVQCVE